MTNTLRIILLACILFYFIIVVSLLKKQRLVLKYTLLWLAMGICMLILVAFPTTLDFIRRVCGFVDAMNALYVCAFGFVFILLMSLTGIVSKQSDRIRCLIQDNALLEKRLRELENEKK